MTTVSIVLTTYNGARYLLPQLESLTRQSRLPIEIVVRDDGSSDDTLSLLSGFARSSPVPVRILEGGGRLGASENFLEAAAACIGEYVAFSDQDDVWLPHKLERCAAALDADHSLLAMHTSQVTDEQLRPLYIGRQGIRATRFFEPAMLNPHDNGWGHQMVFRRELLAAIPRNARPRGPRGGLLPHDTWVYVLAAALGRVSHLDEPLVLYRQHGSNADGAGRQPLSRRIRAMFDTPIDRYRYRAGFCEDMAGLLSELAGRAEAPLAAQAVHAARVYRARAQGVRARIELYRQTSFHRRIRAFRATFASDDVEDAYRLSARLSSRAKDLALGVAALGRAPAISRHAGG